MNTLKRLVPTEELRTNHLRVDSRRPIYVKYDPVFDALQIMLVPPETEVVVHYVGDNVGLLYTPGDLEIVGIQVEAVTHDGGG